MNDETKTEPMSEPADNAKANGAVSEPESRPDPRDEEIANLKEEAAGLKDQLLRALADLDNLRKRAERERFFSAARAFAAWSCSLDSVTPVTLALVISAR